MYFSVTTITRDHLPHISLLLSFSFFSLSRSSSFASSRQGNRERRIGIEAVNEVILNDCKSVFIALPNNRRSHSSRADSAKRRPSGVNLRGYALIRTLCSQFKVALCAVNEPLIRAQSERSSGRKSLQCAENGRQSAEITILHCEHSGISRMMKSDFLLAIARDMKVNTCVCEKNSGPF